MANGVVGYVGRPPAVNPALNFAPRRDRAFVRLALAVPVLRTRAMFHLLFLSFHLVIPERRLYAKGGGARSLAVCQPAESLNNINRVCGELRGKYEGRVRLRRARHCSAFVRQVSQSKEIRNHVNGDPHSFARGIIGEMAVRVRDSPPLSAIYFPFR